MASNFRGECDSNLASRPRSMSSKIAPYETRRNITKRIQSSSSVIEVVGKHHAPDFAAGGSLMPYYCQEIKSETPSRKQGADPPDGTNRSGSNHRRSFVVKPTPTKTTSATRCLEPLKEDSYENITTKSIESPERNPAAISTTSTTPEQMKYASYKLDSIGYLQYHKKQNNVKQPVYPTQMKMPQKEQQRHVNKEMQVRNSTRPQQQWKKSSSRSHPPSKVLANINHDVSEVTLRGQDPPAVGCKAAEKKPVSGPMDPPAHNGSHGRAFRNKEIAPVQSKHVNASRRVSTQQRRSSASTSKTQRQKCNPAATTASVRRSSQHSRRLSNNQQTASSQSQKATHPIKKRPPSRSRSRTPSKNQNTAASRSKDTARTTKRSATPPPVSILKKKDAPPPVAFFGGPAASSSTSRRCNDAAESFTTKSPSIAGSKITAPTHPFDDDHGDDDDETISIDMASVNSYTSALRRGTFAASANNLASQADDSGFLSMESNSTFSDYGDMEESFNFDRTRSHFLRTADLGLTQDTIFAQQFLDSPNSTPEPHYHHPTPHPPQGIPFHIDENWICVDDGKGDHSPIAPQAVDALVAMGYKTVADPMMWTPTKKTRKYMTEKRLTFDDIPIPGPLFEGEGGFNSNCLLWTGKFQHRYHGSELPAIRSQGIVNKSAEEIVDLLMDSSRVDEYNKSSLGRTDEVVLSYGNDADCPFSGRKKKKLTGVVMQGATIIDGCAAFRDTDDDHSDFYSSSGSSSHQRQVSSFVGATKLVRTVNRVPLVKKLLEFTTLLHCRELLDEQGGNGYIIVGRSITPAEDTGNANKKVIKSEILLNVSIIRRLHLSDSGKSRGVSVGSSGRSASKNDLRKRCLLITMNHVKSPLIPKMIAKRVGLSAATTFMSDIRGAGVM